MKNFPKSLRGKTELNFRTKGWSLDLIGDDLVLTALRQRFGVIQVLGMDQLNGVFHLEDSQVQEWIEDFCTRHGVKRGDAMMGVDHPEIVRIVREFPLEAKQTLDEVIQYQAEHFFPGKIEETEFFHLVLSQEETLRVLIYAVPKALLGKVYGAIRRWRVKAMGLTIAELGLMNLMLRLARPEETQRVLCSCQRGRLVVFGLSGNRLTGFYESVWPEDPPALAACLENAFSSLRMDPAEVHRFVLSGTQAELRQEALTDMGLTFHPLSWDRGESIAAEAMEGAGLALGALQEKQPLALNVLPQKMRKRHHQLPVVVALLLALLWGGWFALGQFGAYRELRRELASYRDRNQVLQEQLIELTAAKREYESAKELVGHLEPYLYSEGLVIKCLKILTDLLPEDTHMTSFRINDYNKVTIQIETAQFYAVRKALEAQPYFKNVDTANAISKTRKGDLEKTTVKMELNLEAFHGQEIQ